MNIEEFRSRTKKFLKDEDINRYAEDYEPAYMASGTVNKDDFCAILQWEAARDIVRAMSSLCKAREQDIRMARIACANRDDTIAKLEERVASLTDSLKLISATCDRAFASNANK